MIRTMTAAVVAVVTVVVMLAMDDVTSNANGLNEIPYGA